MRRNAPQRRSVQKSSFGSRNANSTLPVLHARAFEEYCHSTSSEKAGDEPGFSATPSLRPPSSACTRGVRRAGKAVILR